MVSIAGSLSAIPYLLFLALLYFVYVLIMRHKYSKESEGKVWGEFFAKSGFSYGALCKEDKGTVIAPNGHEIGCYFISAECAYDFMYPPGKMRLMQTRIRRSVWMENNPVPKVSVDPSKWIESQKQVEITSYMIETAANESFQKSALEMQKTWWEEISQIYKFVKNSPYAFYASVIAAGGAGFAAIFAYMCYQAIVARWP